jgi:hypothetical protein
MNKKHFEFAAKRIIEYLITYNFSYESYKCLDIYKEYILLFSTFGKNFVKEKFDNYIINNSKHGK